MGVFLAPGFHDANLAFLRVLTPFWGSGPPLLVDFIEKIERVSKLRSVVWKRRKIDPKWGVRDSVSVSKIGVPGPRSVSRIGPKTGFQDFARDSVFDEFSGFLEKR